MKKTIALLTMITIAVVVYSCKKKTEQPTAQVYLDLPATPYVYSVLTFDSSYNQKATTII